MSLFGNVKQTLSDVAGSVLDQSKALSQVAQLQMNLKKLQIERAKRVHDLGKRTFDWYRGGNLVVSGPVPPDVGQLCHDIDDLDRQYSESESQIQAIQEAQAAQAAQQASTGAPPMTPPTAPPTQGQPPQGQPPQPPPGSLNPPHAPIPPAYNPNPNYGAPPNPPGGGYGTSILPGSDGPSNPPAPPGTDTNHPWGPPPGS